MAADGVALHRRGGPCCVCAHPWSTSRSQRKALLAQIAELRLRALRAEHLGALDGGSNELANPELLCARCSTHVPISTTVRSNSHKRTPKPKEPAVPTPEEVKEQMHAEASPSAPPQDDVIGQLDRLRDRGLLSEDEFQVQKQKLLV